MIIDHLTIAGPDLSIFQRFFNDAGMPTDYGGPHSNGITHMALLGFDNGSYIEIVSTLTPGARVPLWQDYLLEVGGGTAWTIDSPGVMAATRTSTAAGIAASDPILVKRHKPDGTIGEWNLAYLGNRQPGGLLPFLIHDMTPRTFRSKPSPSVAGKLWGLSHVVLAVENLASAAAELGKVFPLPELVTWGSSIFGQIATFPGFPIVLADAPEHRRIYGESPCAALIAADDLEAARRDFRLSPPVSFIDQTVVWLGAGVPCRIGVCQRPA